MCSKLLSPAYLEKFLKYCETKRFDYIEEVALTVDQLWAVGNRANATDAPYEKNVLDGTSGNIVARTQDPDLGKGNKLPAQMAIMIFAASVTVPLGNYSTTANKKDTQADLDRTKLIIRGGGRRIAEFDGMEFMDYGPNLITGHDGANGAGASIAGFAGVGSLRRTRSLSVPRILDAESTLEVKHLTDRTTDWGAAFTARYRFPALIGRRG